LQQKLLPLMIKLIARQVMACFVVAVCLLFYQLEAASSFLVGALVVVLPNFMMAFVFFFRWRERSKGQLLLSLYIGELMKLIFSGVLAFFSVKLFSVDIIIMLAGMVFAYIVFWLLSARVVYKKNNVERVR
jgi:ATP synthase protein I